MGKGKKDCGGSTRAHTPITSQAEQGMFGAELRRRREGKKGRMPRITEAELSSHLHESAGKKLPPYAKGSPQMTPEELFRGYRKL
jgi:hypothetical protein